MSIEMQEDPNPLLPGHALSSGEIFIEMKRRLDQGARAAAMATVVKTSGSTPQQVGAKMVIFDDGSFIGTVGGGCVEADIWAEAKEVLQKLARWIFMNSILQMTTKTQKEWSAAGRCGC